MKNLIKADFGRLMKYKPFFILCAILLAFALYLNYGFYMDYKCNETFYIRPFEYFVYISFIITTFISFFSGVNFTDGIIRNKLFCGHSKTKIYLSNAIICAVASAILTVVYLLSGIWAVALGAMQASSYIVFALICIIVSVSFSAIASCFTFVIKGKAIPIVVSAVVLAGMFVATSKLGEKLSEPPYIQELDMDGVEGEDFIIFGDPDEVKYKSVKNDFYIPKGAKRTLMETAYKLLPSSNLYYSMSITFSYLDPENVTAINSDFEDERINSPRNITETTSIIYNITTLLAFTAAGILLFRKEDIK